MSPLLLLSVEDSPTMVGSRSSPLSRHAAVTVAVGVNVC